MSPTSEHPPIERAVVAMSGGVDSSVSALLLACAGVPAIGVSMQVWDYRNNGGCRSRATCCAPDDFTDARRVAASVGIPYYVFDFEQNFRHEVIDKFVRTYREGRTPNPCVDCNAKVKFLELRKRAESLGCSHVATGHYAQIKRDAEGFHLLRGVDAAKDQSYFLYSLSQEELGKTLFPVGHLTKSEVREIAREADLATASKPESQDICFVSGSVSDFLVKLGVPKKQGAILTREGKKVGEHEGIHSVTVGQRKGLHVSGMREPYYVLEIDPLNNDIIVGPKAELQREKFEVEELRWSSPSVVPKLARDAVAEIDALVQVRHRHKGVRVKVRIEQGRAVARFVDGWAALSPGQAAVFYDLDNREVLGGGRICSDFAPAVSECSVAHA